MEGAQLPQQQVLAGGPPPGAPAIPPAPMAQPSGALAVPGAALPAVPAPLPPGALPAGPAPLVVPAGLAGPLPLVPGSAAAAAAAAAARPPVPGQPLALGGTTQAKQKLQELGATLLFEKVLTTSDANGTGRIVIPKGQAESHLPAIDSQQGITLPLLDVFGRKHGVKFRFWINNQSRMYLMENTQEVQSRYGMQVGDVLVFGKLADGSYMVLGRKGTKDDTSRKAPAKRPAPAPAPAAAAAAAADSGGGTPAGAGAAAAAAASSGKKGAASAKMRQQAESLKAKRIKQKQASQQVQSAYTYWSGYSLPPRRDGVFRAVPNSAAQEGDKVVAQYGCWTAIVTLGGELFQAFFESYDAANAAFEAARQSGGLA